LTTSAEVESLFGGDADEPANGQIETLRPHAASDRLDGWVGYRVGIRGAFDDYRDSAVRGAGLNRGITADGLKLSVERLINNTHAAGAKL
jgi:hypothetical protein